MAAGPWFGSRAFLLDAAADAAATGQHEPSVRVELASDTIWVVCSREGTRKSRRHGSSATPWHESWYDNDLIDHLRHHG